MSMRSSLAVLCALVFVVCTGSTAAMPPSLGAGPVAPPPQIGRQAGSPQDSLQTITFEEQIPLPEVIGSQYCNNPATNRGVEFPQGSGRLIEPAVQTASPTHALTNQFVGEEFGEFKKLQIQFTAPQSYVGVKIGLSAAHSSPRVAMISAYDSIPPGTTPVATASVNLGNGPASITADLAITAAAGNVRSVVIAVTGSQPGAASYEVIDDLTYSTVGPPCISDTALPSVKIMLPASDGERIYDPATTLSFSATDLESGVAALQVVFLGEAGATHESFYVCGGPASPGCSYLVYPTIASYTFLTYLPAGTTTIRVRAWDFAGHEGSADRSIDFKIPPPTTNLWVQAMEITQATQSWVAESQSSRSTAAPNVGMDAGAVPLVRGKRTVVRVYPAVEGSGQIPVAHPHATLTCTTSSGAPCPGPTTLSPAASIIVDPALNNSLSTLREEAAHTWNFVLPEAWTLMQGPVRLTASASVPGFMTECSGCADGANQFTLGNVLFRSTAPLKLRLVWACVRRGASVPATSCDHAPFAIYPSVFQAATSLFVQTLPVAAKDIQITLHNPLTLPVDGQFILPGAPMTSDRMGAFHNDVCALAVKDAGKANGEIPINQIYFGIVPAPVTAVLGIGSRSCAIAKLAPDASGGAAAGDIETATEEVGHALGRPHASCDHGEGGCEPAPAVFPCTHGGICTVGFNTATLQTIPPGNPPAGPHAHDFMSYGDGAQWVSPYTYGHLFEALSQAATASAPPVGAVRASEEALLVGGTITAPGSPRATGRFDPLYHLPLPDVSHAAGEGAYALELQDARGQVLFTRLFELVERHGDPPDEAYQPVALFSQILPFDPSATRLVLRHGRTVLAERVRSANDPAIALSAPGPGEIWEAGGPHTIAWEASDQDQGDQLSFTVQYSADGGATWLTLANNQRETSLTLDSSGIAGSDSARVRVLASDGFNTTTAASGAFRVANKPPLVWLTSPAAQGERPAIAGQGATVFFEGSGADLEDGQLDDAAFTWLSSVSGTLGTGRRLDLASLLPGRHTITLEARDRTGATGRATVELAITPAPDAQPVADAGPDLRGMAGRMVQLDGSGSFDHKGDRLTYYWSIVRAPEGGHARLGDSSAAAPGFWADREGEYLVELRVSNALAGSLPDRVAVRIMRPGVYVPLIFR